MKKQLKLYQSQLEGLVIQRSNHNVNKILDNKFDPEGKELAKLDAQIEALQAAIKLCQEVTKTVPTGKGAKLMQSVGQLGKDLAPLIAPVAAAALGAVGSVMAVKMLVSYETDPSNSVLPKNSSSAALKQLK